ncbi:uncharacterized protein LOC136073596 [Hydra vulgaris]|uniref:uncharacterized protein LOC136073596 n=1 Tax=Hydra vulgaris TaxID=6087 RepID=UPI0032EA0692
MPNKMKESLCKDGKCKCILSLIKTSWNKAGFPIVSDKTLRKHLGNLEKEYKSLKKHEKRGSPTDLKKQNNFIQKMKKVFWIGTPNLRHAIMIDKKRFDKDKVEDLKFLDDQESNRKFFLGTKDKKYSPMSRESIRKKTFKRKHSTLEVTANLDQEPNFDENDTEMLNDLDFEPGNWTRRKEKEKPITCIIPKDIYSGSVALAASINDISPAFLQKVVTSVVHKAGVDVGKLHCSISTALSQMKKVNLIISKQARNDIKVALKASKYPPIIHFDGKTLFELKKGKRFKNDR